MTIDDNTGGWDGRPENPDQHGWHWLRLNSGGAPLLFEWRDQREKIGVREWFFEGRHPIAGLLSAGMTAEYLGPCLTPSELAARETAAALAMREEAAGVVNRWLQYYGPLLAPKFQAALRDLSHTFASTPLPTSALDALLAQAREEGAKAEREAIAEWHANNARWLRDPTMQSLPAMPGPLICQDRAQVHEDSVAAIRARGAA